MKCNDSQKCLIRNCIVVVLFVFVFSVGVGLMFNYVIQKQNKLNDLLVNTKLEFVNQIEDLKEKNNLSVKKEGNENNSSLSFSKGEIDMAKKSEWLRYEDKNLGFAFFYPKGYVVSKNDSFIYVSPVDDEENGYIPVMSISILNSSANEQKKVSIEQIIYSNFDRSTIKKIEKLNSNNLQIVNVSFKEIVDEFSTCEHKLIVLNNVLLDVYLYECLEWDNFNDVINTFVKI